MKQKKEKPKKKMSVCDAIFCKDNLARDIIITVIFIGLLAL
jgi:hypothetical protein